MSGGDMIRLEDEDTYSAWTDKKRQYESLLQDKVNLLQVEIDYLKRELAYYKGYRDAMRGT
jgi:hypothetical protein